jgi:hypothetical protein
MARDCAALNVAWTKSGGFMKKQRIQSNGAGLADPGSGSFDVYGAAGCVAISHKMTHRKQQT